MVVVGQSGSFRTKMVVFGPSGCIRENGCIRARVIFLQSGCIRAKVVVFGQKWLYLGKSGCIREEVAVYGQSG